jgi:hypothetical protein
MSTVGFDTSPDLWLWAYNGPKRTPFRGSKLLRKFRTRKTTKNSNLSRVIHNTLLMVSLVGTIELAIDIYI